MARLKTLNGRACGRRLFLRPAPRLVAVDVGVRQGSACGLKPSADASAGRVGSIPTALNSWWTALAGVALVLLSQAGSAGARTAAEPGGVAPQIDDATCVNIPRAPTLIRSDYLAVPSSHQAKAFPVAEVRCLFDTAKLQTASLVKKSIAEDFPVLAAWKPPGVSAVVGDVWKAGTAAAHPAGARYDACGGNVIVVGYDDAKFGGAFEVMKSCGTAKDRDSFFWIRYDDFDKLSTSGVELVGRRARATSPAVIAGRLRLEDASGAAMAMQGQGRTYQLSRPYSSGTQFRLLMSSNGPAYVYLVTSDLTWQIDRVFPDTGDSPHLAYRDNHIMIPAGTTYLRLDDRPGTDYFLALYSLRELDFSTLLQRMQGGQGDLLARLLPVLAKDLVPEAEVRYASADDIAFTAPTTTGSVVAIIVEIRHVQ
jgi:hypothetical protein